MPYVGRSPLLGVRQRFQYTLSSTGTTISGADEDGFSLSYSDSNYVDVYQNGVLLKGGGDDYTATTGTTIVLSTAPTVNDVIEIIVYDVFALADHVKKSGDLMHGILEVQTNVQNQRLLRLTCVDDGSQAGPLLSLNRVHDNPSTNKVLGKIVFHGRDDAGNQTTYGFIDSLIKDETNGSEDGMFRIVVTRNGSLIDSFSIDADECVINEGSTARDFRVESDNNQNMLFVDGSNDAVVIGHNDANDGSVSSAFAFQYIGTDYNSSSMGLARFENSVNAPSVVFHKSRNASIGGDTVVQDDDEMGRIRFFGNDGTDFTEGARITALVDGTPGNNDMPGRLMFSTTADGASSPTERMRIDSSGRVMIATTNTNPASTSGTGNEGHVFTVGAAGQHAISNSVCLDLNRKTTDGTVVLIRQDGSAEGSISVSSSTVTFDGFVGRHESSGISTSTPKGTVLSTIDELDIYPTGTAKEGQTRADHAKVKVSDAVGDSSVYGVVDTYTDDDKVMVASVGIGSVRVKGACAKGDLLESNGDGTAKVQSDDIVRSKTIGKVTIGNSNTAVKLVSCVLYCG